MTGKRFNDDIGWIDVRKIGFPMANFDFSDLLATRRSRNRRAHSSKAGEIIDPQTNLGMMFGRKLSCESPARTDIAVVIDHDAKQIPSFVRRWNDEPFS